MAEQGIGGGARARWTARAIVHHGGRRVFSALGSRAERVPARRAAQALARGARGPARGRASAQDDRPGAAAENGATRSPAGTTATEPQPPGLPPSEHIDKMLERDDYEVIARVWREGPAPLLDPVPGMAERERLRLAIVIPPFRSRQRRPQHALSDLLAPGATRARLQRLGGRLPRARTRPCGRRCCATTSASSSPPSRGPSTRASTPGRAPTSRSRPAGRRSTRRSAARRLPRARLHRQRPRARVLRDLDRARAGRGHLPPRPALHRREPVAARPADRALRGERRRLRARRRRTTPTSRCQSSDAATRSSTTRATPPPDAPSRSA